MSRIEDKKKQIQKFVEELSPEIPEDLKKYESNPVVRAVCERYFEKIIESVFDLAFIFIKEKEMELPEGDDFVMSALAKEKIISSTLADRLDDARRMRNVIVHLYGEIDDAKVFYAVRNELLRDIEEFLEAVQ